MSASALAWPSHFKVLQQGFFHVMGNALSDELPYFFGYKKDYFPSKTIPQI